MGRSNFRKRFDMASDDELRERIQAAVLESSALRQQMRKDRHAMQRLVDRSRRLRARLDAFREDIILRRAAWKNGEESQD